MSLVCRGQNAKLRVCKVKLGHFLSGQVREIRESIVAKTLAEIGGTIFQLFAGDDN